MPTVKTIRKMKAKLFNLILTSELTKILLFFSRQFKKAINNMHATKIEKHKIVIVEII